jgi:hypothetical protein
MIRSGYLFRLFSLMLLAVALIQPSPAWPREPARRSQQGPPQTKPAIFDHAHFDANSIDCIMSNDGLIVDHRVTGRSGMEWPKGTGKTIDFASGLWLAGIGHEDGVLRTAAVGYVSELVPGPWGEDPTAERFRIYKINRDGTGDWDDWPVDQGAPVDEHGDPLLLGDQTLWWVANDGDSAQHSQMWGRQYMTPPMDVEIHHTVFGFDRDDPLGQTMFIRWDIINRGTQQHDSCYVAMWDDPDVGDATDDLVGCDTTLELGYCYNGEVDDEVYGHRPPALGFDLLRGPEEPNGSGRYLGMTAFVYFWCGAPDPLCEPDVAAEAYWHMNGYAGDGTPFLDHLDNETKFCLSGDPVTGTGDIDGRRVDPGDRYSLTSSGPFTLAPGDTQTVIGAKIIARSGSHLHSVAALRYYSGFVQNVFDNDFVFPSPPEPPVTAAALDRKIVLTWHRERETVESFDEHGYRFQGYNVYQGASADGPWTRLATYDVIDEHAIIFDRVIDPETGFLVEKAVQFGSNSGLQRYRIIDQDLIGNAPLSNYRKYYFAVTSYAVAIEMDISPRTIESPRRAIAINDSLEFLLSQEEFERRPNAEAGEELGVSHSGVPLSDGRVEAIVLDPMALTGHTYKVTFFTETHLEDDQEIIETFWRVTDMETGVDVVPRWSNQSGDEDYPIADGLLIKVHDVEDGLKAVVQVANADGPLRDQSDWPDELADEAGEPYGGNDVWHDGSASADSLTTGRWYVSAGGGRGEIERMIRNIENAQDHDFEMRFTDEGGVYLWWYEDEFDTWAEIPFEVWDVGIATYDDPSDDVRCITGGYSGDEVTGGWGDWSYPDPAFGLPATDWIYVRRPEDSLGTYQVFSDDVTSGTMNYDWWEHSSEVLARIIICTLAEEPGPENLPATGTVIRWITNKHNSPADTFAVTAPAPGEGYAIDRSSLDAINVVPNPCFGYNPQERDPHKIFVTFTHLPEHGVKIRIYALDGTLVKIIDDRERELQGTLGTSAAYWYLRNQGEDLSNFLAGVPVASGLYLAHVEVRGVGDKVLKLAVFMPGEQLRIY